jgi:hypothetical protein
MGYAHHKTFMKISLVLPRSTAPLQLKGIVAELPNFSLNVGNLTDAVVSDQGQTILIAVLQTLIKISVSHCRPYEAADFECGHHRRRMSLSSPIPIFIDTRSSLSLISSDLTLKTSNAGITGTFNISGSLHMTTSNAPITVTVGLESNAEKRPTTLVMHTSNK